MGVKKILFFAIVILTICATPGLADEASPDVEVTYIERNPKQERYQVNYSGKLAYFDEFVPYRADAATSSSSAGWQATRYSVSSILTVTALLSVLTS